MSHKSIQKWGKKVLVGVIALAGTMLQGNGCTLQVNGLDEFLNGIGTDLDFGEDETFTDEGLWDWYPTWDSMPSYGSGGDTGSACPVNS